MKIESTGVGIATMTVVGFLDIYYCVIIAWTFFYLFATYSTLPGLPWATCGKYFSLPFLHFFLAFFYVSLLGSIKVVPSSTCDNVVKLFLIDHDLI